MMMTEPPDSPVWDFMPAVYESISSDLGATHLRHGDPTGARRYPIWLETPRFRDRSSFATAAAPGTSSNEKSHSTADPSHT